MSDQTRLFDMDRPTRVGHQTHLNEYVYIGRANDGNSHMLNTEIGSPGWLGNPFPKSKHGRKECVDKFRVEFESRLKDEPEFRNAVASLSGSILGCYCQRLNDEGPLCHGEVIAEWADKLSNE